MAGLARRHWMLLAVTTAVGVVLVAVAAYARPKVWEADATVTLDPFPISGLHGEAADATPAEAMAGEEAAAGGARFHDAVVLDLGHEADFTVDGDVAASSLRFTARSDSSKRAFETAVDVANGYVAWGRRQQAAERVAGLQVQLDQLGADPASPADPAQVAELTAEMTAAQSALDQLPGAGGVLSLLPEPPNDPARPDLAARLVLGAAIGLLVGAVSAWLLDRRRPASPDAAAEDAAADAPPPGSRGGRAALGVLVVVVPVIIAAPVLAAIVQVWELRPTTADTEMTDYGCLAEWAAAVPDGRAVVVSEDSQAFFRDHLHEYVLPRLTVPGEGRPPATVLHVVAGDGPHACGGWHLEVEGP